MLPDKKIKSRSNKDGESKEIDFDYITYMSMNRLGFSYKETMRMYLGKFIDLMEVYKRDYNFKVKRMLYIVEEEKKVTSLMEL